MELRKAEKAKSKLRIGLSGTSGSGKTTSALLLANGMTPWEKICVIDTEHGSADLYSHLGAYNVIRLEAPFTPERYMEAITTAENAGMEVIIIDSMTHEWDGKGGVLDVHDSMPGNSYTNWSKLTPRHNAFIEKILESRAHVICSLRSKQDYVLVEKNGKQVPEKVGLKAITRDGVEYEFTLVFDINIKHQVTASKDRTGIFMDQPEFIITQETGKKLVGWAESGSEVKTSPKPLEQTEIKTPIIVTREEPKKMEVFDEYDEKAIAEAFNEGIENPLSPLNQPESTPQLPASDKQRKMIYAISKNLNYTDVQMKELIKKITGKDHSSELSLNEAKKLIDHLINLQNQ